MSNESNQYSIPKAPVSHQKRKLSSVWLIPLIALVIGGWLIWENVKSRGQIVEIRFNTAEGVEAGKTKILCRSVKIGMVETVYLTDDLSGVRVFARINPEHERLLRQDSRFWVVRPRIGGGGISGLGTIVAGTHIELDPGTDETISLAFNGLEDPPITAQGTPGVRITLVSKEAGSLGPGSPIYFRGVQVGKIEANEFNTETAQVTFDAFITSPYEDLITDTCKFWNVSGVKLDMSADGFDVQVSSLESLLAGGVAFDYSEGIRSGAPIEHGFKYRLYQSRDESNAPRLDLRLTYQLYFDESIRGLKVGAPVEFRGIRIGTVSAISLVGVSYESMNRIPVRIQIDPSRLVEDAENVEIKAMAFITDNIKNGLRASLKTGNLITGQLYVDLDIEDNPQDKTLSFLGPLPSLPTIPTTSTGITRLEDQLTSLLEKLQDLKIEELVKETTTTISSFGELSEDSKKLIADLRESSFRLNAILESPDLKALPEDLRTSLASIQKTVESYGGDSDIQGQLHRTLEELRYSLRSINRLAETLDRRPNSILFGRSTGNPKPPKAKQ